MAQRFHIDKGRGHAAAAFDGCHNGGQIFDERQRRDAHQPARKGRLPMQTQTEAAQVFVGLFAAAVGRRIGFGVVHDNAVQACGKVDGFAQRERFAVFVRHFSGDDGHAVDHEMRDARGIDGERIRSADRAAQKAFVQRRVIGRIVDAVDRLDDVENRVIDSEIGALRVIDIGLRLRVRVEVRESLRHGNGCRILFFEL